LKHELKRTRTAQTEHLPIGGGKNYPETEFERSEWLDRMQKKTRLSRERLDTLLSRYGTRAEAVSEFLTMTPDIPLHHHTEFSQREIKYIAECENVIHLDDLVLRRTLLALLGQLDRALLEEIASIVSEVLDWSTEVKQLEIKRTLQILETDHGVRLA
jgi:glycerol-3-phosphate dehydrogenase